MNTPYEVDPIEHAVESAPDRHGFRAVVAAAGLSALVLSGCGFAKDLNPSANGTANMPEPGISQSLPGPSASESYQKCFLPAPDTAAGYQKMFAEVPATGDGAFSVPVPDGRDVWIFGDTTTVSEHDEYGTTAHPHWTGFVHSSAIVQEGGCVHESNEGAQLLPDDNPNLIYWPESAHVDTNGKDIDVVGQQVKIGKSAWDFHGTGHARTFKMKLTPAGDLDLIHEGPLYKKAAPASGKWYHATPNVPGHYGYLKHAHPEAKLADGKELVTICQGDNDPVIKKFKNGQVVALLLPHPLSWYRPILKEEKK